MRRKSEDKRVDLIERVGFPIFKIITEIADDDLSIILSLLGSYLEKALKTIDDPEERRLAATSWITMFMDRLEIPYDTSYKN